MAIEVRCNCGQLVYAEDRLIGQYVQCPHCKASVGVPVAAAAPAPPNNSSPAGNTGDESGVVPIAVGVLLLVLVGAFSDQLGGSFAKSLSALGWGGIIIGGISLGSKKL